MGSEADCQSVENSGFPGLLGYPVCRLWARMMSDCSSTASRLSGWLIVPESFVSDHDRVWTKPLARRTLPRGSTERAQELLT